MKVKIQDAKALRAITPSALAAYARNLGWRRVGLYRTHSHFCVGENLPKIIVPGIKELADYASVVSDLIGVFADVTKSDELAVYRSLMNESGGMDLAPEEYSAWLKAKVSVPPSGEAVEITTPYLDRHNDYLQIYARRENGELVLTDDGYVLDDLDLSGCRLDTPKRRALFEATLNGFGVRQEGGVLEIRASEDDFALQKHNLVQAMLAIGDLFYLASSSVESFFHEDVAAWLDESEIRHTPNIKLTGKSGFDHRFHFVVPKSPNQPERVIQVINRPGRESAQAITFAWMDTKEARSPEGRAYAFLNDAERTTPGAVADAMRSYGLHPIPWSKREEVRGELAA